jgi:hypothetical protein
MRAAILLFALAVPTVVSAAEDPDRAPAPRQGTVTTVVEMMPADLSLSLYGRLSIPGDTYVDSSGYMSYSDLFKAGGGFGLEAALLFHQAPHWRVGGYLSFGVDWFEGQSVLDDVGDTLKPDTMTITTGLIGAKGRFLFGPGFFCDGYLGLGVAHYNAVDSTFVIGGVPLTGVELMAASNEFALESGMRIGWGTPHVAVLLGLGFRYLGVPVRGKGVTSEISPEAFSTLTLDLGVQFTF